MAALQKQQPAARPNEQAKHKGPPDMFEDPTGFAEYIVRQNEARFEAFQQQQRNERVQASMETAEKTHGDAFKQAFTALTSLDASNPRNRAFVAEIVARPNPGEAIVAWHKRSELQRRIGADPDAYERQLIEKARKDALEDPEFLKTVFERARSDASTGNDGRPRSQVRLPQSLARTAGNNTRLSSDRDVFDGSESAIADSAWN